MSKNDRNIRERQEMAETPGKEQSKSNVGKSKFKESDYDQIYPQRPEYILRPNVKVLRDQL
ncbi:hypothetical protein Taro_056325 [Colocasia esculenta]|uniref:Uncharacterized protein n=1 Tax=Colocasia esculenta TaxID=4460 RepID=A0A843XW02_COLES|nr:hypothetical protein [Colocasia esculenta]